MITPTTVNPRAPEAIFESETDRRNGTTYPARGPVRACAVLINPRSVATRLRPSGFTEASGESKTTASDINTPATTQPRLPCAEAEFSPIKIWARLKDKRQRRDCDQCFAQPNQRMYVSMAGMTICNCEVPLNHNCRETRSAPAITDSQAAIPATVNFKVRFPMETPRYRP